MVRLVRHAHLRGSLSPQHRSSPQRGQGTSHLTQGLRLPLPLAALLSRWAQGASFASSQSAPRRAVFQVTTLAILGILALRLISGSEWA